jgi:hypothetical protein
MNVLTWHECEVQRCPLNDRYRGVKRVRYASLAISLFDFRFGTWCRRRYGRRLGQASKRAADDLRSSAESVDFRLARGWDRNRSDAYRPATCHARVCSATLQRQPRGSWSAGSARTASASRRSWRMRQHQKQDRSNDGNNGQVISDIPSKLRIYEIRLVLASRLLRP